MKVEAHIITSIAASQSKNYDSLCLNFFHLLFRKPNVEKFSIF